MRKATVSSPRPSPAGRRGPTCTLLPLAVLRVLAAARAKLAERHAVRIAPLVLLSVVGSLAAVRASERDQDAVRFLRHLASTPRTGHGGRCGLRPRVRRRTSEP